MMITGYLKIMTSCNEAVLWIFFMFLEDNENGSEVMNVTSLQLNSSILFWMYTQWCIYSSTQAIFLGFVVIYDTTSFTSSDCSSVSLTKVSLQKLWDRPKYHMQQRKRYRWYSFTSQTCWVLRSWHFKGIL